MMNDQNLHLPTPSPKYSGATLRGGDLYAIGPVWDIRIMVNRRILAYNPKLKQVARMLRKNMTLSEIILWQHLKGRQMLGYDFDRQKPIGDWIVDFFCRELSMAVEIDGVSHDDRGKEDLHRQRRLEGMGVKFLRFQDSDVKNNLQEVLLAIEDWIRDNG